MNSDQGDFEALRKLMALKRHEQPPPGYFHLLPSRIITRIENGEGQDSFWEEFLSNFSIRPIWACAIGFSFCAAVVVGTLYPLATDATMADLPSNHLTALGFKIRAGRRGTVSVSAGHEKVPP